MGGWVGGWVGGGAALSPNVSEPDGAPVAGTDAPHARLGQHSSLRLHLHARNRKRLQGDRAVAPSRRVVPRAGVPHVLHCIGRSQEAGGPRRDDIGLRDGAVVLWWLSKGGESLVGRRATGGRRPTTPTYDVPGQPVAPTKCGPIRATCAYCEAEGDKPAKLAAWFSAADTKFRLNWTLSRLRLSSPLARPARSALLLCHRTKIAGATIKEAINHFRSPMCIAW